MTESKLSPAAQAVLDAANNENSYGPDDCLNESRWIVAAALRAAADQLTFEDSLAGAVINPRELLDIATELEIQ